MKVEASELTAFVRCIYCTAEQDSQDCKEILVSMNFVQANDEYGCGRLKCVKI